MEGVSVSVPGKRIVETADLYVGEGEFVGLIGPNGSGKSTLLKTVYRVMKRECGSVAVGGEDTDGMSLRQSALKMSVVSQHNYGGFDFRVGDVVAMGRTPYKKAMEPDNAEDRAIVDGCLEKVGMLHCRSRGFSSLSGGERQRIVLARALAQRTPCMILDEPTNHLDIKYQLEILDIVKSLHRTVLCALHDLNLASQYCDRIYVMDCGRIVADGTPEEVITERMIMDVYGTGASVSKHPVTGFLNIAYYPGHGGRP